MQTERRIVPTLILLVLILVTIVPPASAVSYEFFAMWGTGGSSDGEFGDSGDLEVSASGDVYVLDTGNCRVQVFGTAGTFIDTWGESEDLGGDFHLPYGIGLNSTGHVYTTEFLQKQVKTFTPGGDLVQQWETGFGNPNGIAVNASGHIYIADQSSGSIEVFAPDGTLVHKWEGEPGHTLTFPKDVALGPDERVFVADTLNHRIQVFEPDGTYVRRWGSFGTDPGEFFMPSGIAVDESGQVFVADSANNRIQVFGSDGTFLTQMGASGTGEGEFNIPEAVAVSEEGYVYVFDSNNCRVQVLAPEQPLTVTTVTPASALTGTIQTGTTITGSDLRPGATINLTRSGEVNITATGVEWISRSALECTLDLTGAATGSWNVTVTNPKGETATITDGFTVEEVPTVTPTPTPLPVRAMGGSKSTTAVGAGYGLNAGDNCTVIFDESAITSLTLTAKKNIPSLIVTAKKASRPSNAGKPNGTVYQYAEITLYRITDEEVTGAVLGFSVPVAWLEEQGVNPADVVLLRWHDGEWQDLPTRVIAAGKKVIRFRAKSPGCSAFAIVSRPEPLEPAPVNVPQTTPLLPEVTAAEPVGTPAAAATPTPAQSPLLWAPLLTLPLLLLLRRRCR